MIVQPGATCVVDMLVNQSVTIQSAAERTGYWFAPDSGGPGFPGVVEAFPAEQVYNKQQGGLEWTIYNLRNDGPSALNVSLTPGAAPEK
jgi:hypothetical protein